jgi:hypothetical protein
MNTEQVLLLQRKALNDMYTIIERHEKAIKEIVETLSIIKNLFETKEKETKL